MKNVANVGGAWLTRQTLDDDKNRTLFFHLFCLRLDTVCDYTVLCQYVLLTLLPPPGSYVIVVVFVCLFVR